MCKECAACYIATRSNIEQQLTLSRLLQDFFGPGYHGHMVCLLEKGRIISGGSCLHNEPRQTLDRTCASVQGHAGAVLWTELAASLEHLQPFHLRHANRLPADLELELTDGECI